MKTTKIVAFIAALLWITRIDLAAQEKEFIGVGARIRVTAPAISTPKLVGTLVALNADTLFLQAENSAFSTPLTIPPALIARVEVNRGKGSRGKSALKGSVIGFGGAFVPTFVVLAVNATTLDMGGGDVLLYSLIGGAGGLVLGGIIGSQLPSERWEVIPADRIHVKMSPSAKAQERESKKGIVFITGGVGVGNTRQSSKNRNGINSAFRLGFNLDRSFSLNLGYEINDRNDEKPLSTDRVMSRNSLIVVRTPEVLSTRSTLITAQANLLKGLFISTSAGLGIRRTFSYWPVFGALDPNTRRPTIERYEGSFSAGGSFVFGFSAGYELIRLRAFSFLLEGTYRQYLGEYNSRRPTGLQGLISLSL